MRLHTICWDVYILWQALFHIVSFMTWGKVRSLGKGLGECFYHAAFCFFNPKLLNPLFGKWHFPAGVATFSDMLCQDKSIRTLGRKRGTHWKWSCICVRPGQFLGYTFETYLVTVDRNGMFHHFMGHSMLLLYYNKGVLCYESTGNRNI